MSVDFERDESVSFQAGTVDFVAEGVIFRLPKSVLQRFEGSAFANMIGDSNGSTDEPIHVDDSNEIFSEFRRIIYTPFECCLSQAHPSSKDLEKVLKILKFSRKYCITIVETMATAIAGRLTRTVLLLRSHITPTLSPLDILIYALDTECSVVAKTARLVVEEDLWTHDLSSYKLLSIVTRYEERELIAVAYYQVLLKGMSNWMFEEELDESHHHALHIGIARLSAEWESIFSDWGESFDILIKRKHSYINNQGIQTLECTVSGEVHGKIWRALAERNLYTFDVIGRLNLVKGMDSLDLHEDVVLPIVNRQLKHTKLILHTFFQDPPQPQEVPLPIDQ